MSGQAESFKFSTILFIILGLILPLWPITLPLFWYLAYRSYKSGGGASPAGGGSAAELANWKKLLDDGAISRDEFEQQKSRLLGR